MDYRFGATHYLISIENPHGLNRGVQQVSLNGIALPDHRVPLSDDQRPHEVRITLGNTEPQPDEQGQQPPDSTQATR